MLFILYRQHKEQICTLLKGARMFYSRVIDVKYISCLKKKERQYYAAVYSHAESSLSRIQALRVNGFIFTEP